MTRKQELAIAALLSESTHAAAAAKCGIGESTLWRWLRNEEFQTAYRSARRAPLDAVIAHLERAANEAVTCLRRNLTCGRPGAEIRAAGIILTQVVARITGESQAAQAKTMNVTEIEREKRELRAEFGRVVAALAPFPEAREAVLAALRGPQA